MNGSLIKDFYLCIYIYSVSILLLQAKIVSTLEQGSVSTFMLSVYHYVLYGTKQTTIQLTDS